LHIHFLEAFRLTLIGREISPDECQSKSFEKINTLLSAIFRFRLCKFIFDCPTFDTENYRFPFSVMLLTSIR